MKLNPMKLQRFSNNPLIRPDLHPSIGGNLNGPSLLRVPPWLPNPLGRYYLYFSHHKGTFIRLAYADRLEGPWQIHGPGALRLEQTVCDNHIASPDVHVDEERRQIRMYFHGPAKSGPPVHAVTARQYSFVATSPDGLSFSARPQALGAPYFRVFQWQGATYALGMPGVFYRSADGLSDFEAGPTLFSSAMRHSAVWLRGHTLHVFYSDAGDCPERILHSTLDLRPDWRAWLASPAEVLLEPELDYEGAGLSLEPSERGWAPDPVRQLRDPAIFTEEGRAVLLYSVAGEAGIAAAEVLG